MNHKWVAGEVEGKSVRLLAAADGRPRFGLLLLPDNDRDAPAGLSSALTAAGIACIVPEGPSCWWVDRTCPAFDPARTPERFLLDATHPWMLREWNLAANRVALAGVGVGGQGALRLGLRHPERFPVVAAIGAALDFHELYGRGTTLDDLYPSREHARQDTAILHIHPARQPRHLWFAADPADPHWFRGNDRLHEKLSALGVPHTFEQSVRVGGPAEYAERMLGPMIEFIAGALGQEARRLL